MYWWAERPRQNTVTFLADNSFRRFPFLSFPWTKTLHGRCHLGNKTSQELAHQERFIFYKVYPRLPKSLLNEGWVLELQQFPILPHLGYQFWLLSRMLKKWQRRDEGYIGLGVLVKGEPGFRDLSCEGIPFDLRETHQLQRKMLQAAQRERIVWLQSIPRWAPWFG